MGDDEDFAILYCDFCRSRQIRTTKKERICIRCGHKEELDKITDEITDEKKEI